VKLVTHSFSKPWIKLCWALYWPDKYRVFRVTWWLLGFIPFWTGVYATPDQTGVADAPIDEYT
jgi:hypothetical protein